ncbi:MAG: UDP-3-O-(3-hydroxymyristoyl)glucosamine N-acyltransferase [bacterium]
MILTADDIARKLNGKVQGDGSVAIKSVASLKQAGAGDLAFLGNPRYLPDMAKTCASAVLVNEDWQGETAVTLIRVKSADAAFAQAAFWLARPVITHKPGIHPTSVIAADAKIGKDVTIGPHCVIELGAVIGDGTVLVAHCYVGHFCEIGRNGLLYPQVSLREYCKVGDRVILHNGAVIGSDGFGYVKDGSHWKKIPQVGIVVLGDDVEIGANTTIDRARFGETRIGNGTKLDNLIQVAHNVTIGEDTALAAQVGMAGSCHIGNRVQMGGQVGVAGHIAIGDDAIVMAQSGVSKDVPPASILLGTPAMPAREFKKLHANSMRLPELKQKVAELEARIKMIEGKS